MTTFDVMSFAIVFAFGMAEFALGVWVGRMSR